MKTAFTVILIIVVISAVVFVAKDLIAQMLIVNAVKHLTGLGLSLQSVDLDILKTAVDLKGLKIYNPADYPDKLMAELPRLYIDYSIRGILKGRMHLPELQLYLKDFEIIKNRKGRLNIADIKAIGEQKKQAKETAAAYPILIDTFKLKIDRVAYRDYSQGLPATLKEFNLNLDETFKDITDLRALVNIIILKALRNSAIDKLANFDLSIITDYLPKGLQQGSRIVTEGATALKEAAAKGVTKTSETIKQAAEAFKDIFTSQKQDETTK